MNLYAVGRRLWEERVAGLVFAVLAVIAAILVTFHVSVSPPSLRPRALQLGVAGTSVLVDGTRSTLGSVDSNSQHFDNLAADYAQLTNSAPVIAPIARALHVSPFEVGVQVQVTSQVPLSQSQPLEPQVGTQILATRRHYYLVARVSSGSQIVQLYAQAPTGAKARTMVQAAVASLRSYISSAARAQHVPRAERITLRPLGHLYASTLDRHVSEEAAVLIAVLAWVLAMIAVITIRGQARRARLERSWAAPFTV